MRRFYVDPRPLHPEGVYSARLVDIEEDEGAFNTPRVIWWLQSSETNPETGRPYRLGYVTGYRVAPDSDLGELLAALGVALPTTNQDAGRLNPLELLESSCRIQVEHVRLLLGEQGEKVAAVLPA